MKNYNYFDFLGGKKVTIRKILEEEHQEKASYYTIKLYETKEKVHIGVKPECARFVKPNATLFYASQDEDSIKYTEWKNGIGPLGMLSQESLNSY